MDVMKRLLLMPLFAFIALTVCDNLNISPDVPECIVSETKKFKRQAPCNSGNSVAEYTFQGKKVYTFSQGGDYISDAGSELVDSDCNNIGYLGGLIGIQEVNGVNFSANAVFTRTIWEN